MPQYKAPVQDMQFLLFDVYNAEQHYAHIGAEDASRDMLEAIMAESARFCEQVLAPLNQSGDQEGCTWTEDGVTTPSGFREAYQQFVENGWPSLASPVEYGGQGLPESVGHIVSEMSGTANWAWSMYPGLSHGARNTIALHGTDEQKETYLGRLSTGEWTGTMCLTEAHCGSDLGLLKTSADPQEDGSYRLNGTKIFISSGDHDMAENIVHIVLARLPGAPSGTKGISLFIVPKFLPDGTRNAVNCGSLEHKMGIHGNATCVMNFDGATGFLIGPENKGLNCMFTFMNFARIGTAMQGVASAELSYQGALAYAKDRLAMRALSGPKNPDGPADPIIVHPDVRRMLLTQKAFAEGGRAMLYDLSQQVDLVHNATDEAERQVADDLLSFLTPIAKAFLTEAGLESANHGVQVFGGHGYIQEWGMEQIVRDARIATLYEGTTGIQALDLLGRKVLMTQGKLLKSFTRVVHKFCKAHDGAKGLKPVIKTLNDYNKEWGDITTKIGMKAMMNKEEVGGAAYDYLMYSGYVTLAYYWARMAVTAQEKLKDADDKAFYQAKLDTAQFYFDRILPRAGAHKAAMLSGLDNLMTPDL
ncbi:MAG: acyl-CoA dehydrogenase C-terminal domain-containing protein [Natronospirillum sp.]|uniref:acyl-CoA dehydrogenase C-terminal domain-containing protein n=1 Tax=Natronospirillum sp. TaxID=2812955 RepID=UPI0025E3E870|nr:acyl-CoA dehydrogenase C-terminal domain-containing protein [Natronospirillum sp.]MCH8552074.1 acyl-CoA dehydrogenase C-terminal domain-containing protein [Natronospirillum sp.]